MSIEFLIVHQQQGDHWFFSKGHVEKWETEQETALREINEEVWLSVTIIPWFRETYSYEIVSSDIKKTVVFFLAEAKFGDVTLSDELQNALRLDYEQAIQQLTYMIQKRY